MRFKAVKGTRDFYPEQMALRNYIVDSWRRVSLRNGFVEFDGPVLEYLDLLTAKSGEEIASQLFSFVDRGGRQLALRPEITPTLARMVSAKINSLPRPIKWFSVPRLFRAENPQKGRLREFFQWNVDIIGADNDILADAECIFTAVDFLHEVGLTHKDIIVRIGSRPLTVAMLRAVGVSDDKMDSALSALDKRSRVSPEAFIEIATAAGIPAESLDDVCRFQDSKDLQEIKERLSGIADAEVELEKIRTLMGYLDDMGLSEYYRLDMHIVRGLAYYTGIVYEIFDRAGSLRAIAGGGRYDNLLKLVGGPEIGATGFGMGDAVLEILLREKGKIPELSPKLDCFVVDAEGNQLKQVISITTKLRWGGIAADFASKPQPLRKQLTLANRRNARYALIVQKDNIVGIKNLATGEQKNVEISRFLENPREYLISDN